MISDAESYVLTPTSIELDARDSNVAFTDCSAAYVRLSLKKKHINYLLIFGRLPESALVCLHEAFHHSVRYILVILDQPP